MHSRVARLVLVATVAALGACSGGGSDEPKPTQSASTPSQTQAADPLDPCALVPDAVLDSVNIHDREPAVGLMLGNEEFVSCQLDDTETFTWGYRAVRLSDQPLSERLPSSEKTSGIGDESYTQSDPQGYQLWIVARFGEHEILVRNSSLGNTDPANVVSAEDTTALAKAFGKALPDGLEKDVDPVNLTDACPATDSPEVTAVIGDVVLARGPDPRGADDVQCHYLGKGGTRLLLEKSTLSNAKELYDARSDRADDIDVKGADQASIDTSSGALLSWIIGDALYTLDATALTRLPDYESDRTIGKKDAVALAEVMIKSAG